MLSLSSYHTAIIQTGAAMFSVAAPVAAPAFVPMYEIPGAWDKAPLRAVNDNAGLEQVGVVGQRSDRSQVLDDAHNEAIFNALLGSSIEVSAPFMID
jgi:hypothetical protein